MPPRSLATSRSTFAPRATRASADGSVFALEDALAFPSDSPGLVLEQNDVVFLFQSDRLDQVSTGLSAFMRRLDGMFELTSIRKGFVGGGFGGGRSLPKRMATAAGVPGAESIPDNAELFLGFTSTQRASLGAGRIANFESIPGLTDQWPNGYFRNGTIMHLSHMLRRPRALVFAVHLLAARPPHVPAEPRREARDVHCL